MKHLDYMIHLCAKTWCAVQVFRLEWFEPSLLFDETKSRRKLDDAVLDGRERPSPTILAVGCENPF